MFSHHGFIRPYKKNQNRPRGSRHYHLKESSNLIGWELRSRLNTTHTKAKSRIQCFYVMNLYYHTKNYQNRQSGFRNIPFSKSRPGKWSKSKDLPSLAKNLYKPQTPWKYWLDAWNAYVAKAKRSKQRTEEEHIFRLFLIFGS